MEVLDEIKSFASDEQAMHLSRFFKTAKGQYGEGDIFLGIKVPVVRAIAKKYYKTITLSDIQILITNPYHEVRLLALLLMVFVYENTDLKEEIFNLYLKNIQYINNWDLVDLSCPKLVGNYVYVNKVPDIIYKLADSSHLWSNRIAVVSQYYFIKRGDFSILLELSEKFLTHKHDLMHKAVGWMLREMGKVDEKTLLQFLDKHYKVMPRTMLRYAIERLPIEKRLYYMNKNSRKSSQPEIK